MSKFAAKLEQLEIRYAQLVEQAKDNPRVKYEEYDTLSENISDLITQCCNNEDDLTISDAALLTDFLELVVAAAKKAAGDNVPLAVERSVQQDFAFFNGLQSIVNKLDQSKHALKAGEYAVKLHREALRFFNWAASIRQSGTVNPLDANNADLELATYLVFANLYLNNYAKITDALVDQIIKASKLPDKKSVLYRDAKKLVRKLNSVVEKLPLSDKTIANLAQRIQEMNASPSSSSSLAAAGSEPRSRKRAREEVVSAAVPLSAVGASSSSSSSAAAAASSSSNGSSVMESGDEPAAKRLREKSAEVAQLQAELAAAKADTEAAHARNQSLSDQVASLTHALEAHNKCVKEQSAYIQWLKDGRDLDYFRNLARVAEARRVFAMHPDLQSRKPDVYAEWLNQFNKAYDAQDGRIRKEEEARRTQVFGVAGNLYQTFAAGSAASASSGLMCQRKDLKPG